MNTKKTEIKCTKCNELSSSSSKYCSRCGFELPKIDIPEKKPVEKSEKKTKSKTVSIIFGIIAFGISFFVAQKLVNNSMSFDKEMLKVASEINENCPIMVDADTRLDNTIALPNNIFQYNYTLVNLEKSQVNLEEMKSLLEPNIINSVKTNPDMKIQRENKVTMSYYYKDKNGIFLLKINVTPEKYE